MNENSKILKKVMDMLDILSIYIGQNVSSRNDSASIQVGTVHHLLTRTGLLVITKMDAVVIHGKGKYTYFALILRSNFIN